jgi:hypothetical protein
MVRMVFFPGAPGCHLCFTAPVAQLGSVGRSGAVPRCIRLVVGPPVGRQKAIRNHSKGLCPDLGEIAIDAGRLLSAIGPGRAESRRWIS